MKSAFYKVHITCFVLFMATFALQIEGITQATVTGCVVEQGTEKPIPFASVLTAEGSHGVVANENGCFVIQVGGFPVQLIIRLLGYDDKTILIQEEDAGIIEMTSTTYKLEEMNIQAVAGNRFAGNLQYDVWDYCWMGENILLCEFKNSLSHARLVLLSQDGDTLAKGVPPSKPSSLFTDCTGEAYFVSKDSLWPCYRMNDRLYFGQSESASLISDVFQFCSGQNEKSIFFAIPAGKEMRIGADEMAFNYKTNNDKMNYYVFDRQHEKLKLIRSISDTFIQDLKEDEIAYGNGPQPVLSTSSGYSVAASKMFFYTIMCHEIDAPMYYMNDELYILNNTEGYLERMDEFGIELSKLPIGFFLDPTYNRLSVVDEQHQHIYLLSEKSGKITLNELDLSTGQIASSKTIPDIFPEKLTVNDGSIYYLCRDNKRKEARVLNRIRMK